MVAHTNKCRMILNATEMCLVTDGKNNKFISCKNVHHTHILDGLWEENNGLLPTAAGTGKQWGFFPLSDSVFLMWLHEVFTAMHRFPLVAIKQGLSLQWPLIAEHSLQQLLGSVVVACRL